MIFQEDIYIFWNNLFCKVFYNQNLSQMTMFTEFHNTINLNKNSRGPQHKHLVCSMSRKTDAKFIVLCTKRVPIPLRIVNEHIFLIIVISSVISTPVQQAL